MKPPTINESTIATAMALADRIVVRWAHAGLLRVTRDAHVQLGMFILTGNPNAATKGTPR